MKPLLLRTKHKQRKAFNTNRFKQNQSQKIINLTENSQTDNHNNHSNPIFQQPKTEYIITENHITNKQAKKKDKETYQESPETTRDKSQMTRYELLSNITRKNRKLYSFLASNNSQSPPKFTLYPKIVNQN